VEGAEEAETDRARVEARGVSSLSVPATTLVHLSGVTDAEVVADVSPSVGVHVEVLDVSHLSVTESLSVAAGSIGVVNNEVSWRLGWEN
jgi:hypothetical protein